MGVIEGSGGKNGVGHSLLYPRESGDSAQTQHYSNIGNAKPYPACTSLRAGKGAPFAIPPFIK